jgi:hypothetical protein
LMNDLHLLDNGGFSAFAGACAQMVSSFIRLRGKGGMILPSSRILHSRRNRFESSSSLLSMA